MDDPILSVDLYGLRQSQHLSGWAHCLASRRTVFKQLEQFAGVFASKLSSDRFVGINGMNSGSIWQPPTNNDALMSPFTATRSRAWIIDSASTIAAPRSPNERIQSPISRPAELRVVRKTPTQRLCRPVYSISLAAITLTLGESLGRFWACNDHFGGVPWPFRGNRNLSRGSSCSFELISPPRIHRLSRRDRGALCDWPELTRWRKTA